VKIEKIIKERILKKGPITFKTFMDMALYFPKLGYYQRKFNPIGPQGDYYTSPHLHPIFGWMIALQIEEINKILKTKDFTIIEIGAGKGYLTDGILYYLTNKIKIKEFKYIIIEKNPEITQQQKALLSDYKDIIQWKENLEDIEEFVGCVLSNELIDSFAVHLIEFHNNFYKEIYVDVKEDSFIEIYGELSTLEIKKYIDKYNIPYIEGYRTEVNLMIKDYFSKLSNILSEGFLITIDYGYTAKEYYSEERKKGTLLCYYKHTINENPYINVGKQDITTHVNFSAMKDFGEIFGFKTLGYSSQGSFLVSLGIDKVISEEIINSHNSNFFPEIQKIKGLIFGMGESHKVMLQYKGKKEIKELKGFQLRNKMYQL